MPTIHELHKKLVNKEISAVELTNAVIAHKAKVEPTVHAYLSDSHDRALTIAKVVDEAIAKGEAISPLAGIPGAIKDNICIKDEPATCASKMLENFVPPYNASVIERLQDNHYISLGKLNMDEFAMGGSTENSALAKTTNPWNIDCVPGGSSGGSAAAVSSGSAIWALGSDNTTALVNDVQNLKIGVPKEFFGEGLNSEVRKAIEEAIETYKKLGAEIVEVSLPNSKYALSAYYIIALAEASSNLARYDGVSYGMRVPADNLVEMSTKTRTEGFGPEVQRRILLGTYVLSAGYYDAYYLKALKVRRLIKNEFDEAFSKVDLILTPTAPNTSYKFGEKANDPLAMYLEDICTVPANLAGIPGISIPAGMSSSNLPIGLQLLGPAMGEETLLRAAFTFEQARPDCQLVAPTGEVSL